MERVELLNITSNDLFYGGAHKGTFTVETEDVENLRVLLGETREVLSASNSLDNKVQEKKFEILEQLDNLIDHIDEYIEEEEDGN